MGADQVEQRDSAHHRNGDRCRELSATIGYQHGAQAARWKKEVIIVPSIVYPKNTNREGKNRPFKKPMSTRCMGAAKKKNVQVLDDKY